MVRIIGKLALPPLDAWNATFIERALLEDRCSCAPDKLWTPKGMVYIGNVCLRHDERYDWIRRQRIGTTAVGQYLNRLRLKWMADIELGDGIKEAFHREGIHVRFIPLAYRIGVIAANFPFRILIAIWKDVTFRS